jgi:outer membrane protein assembly factor BamB
VVDGKVIWEWIPPNWFEFDKEPIGHFVLRRGRVFALQGQRCLFTLDGESGRTLWSHEAPGGHAPPSFPGGRFNPFFHVDRERVVLQTNAGCWRMIDNASGRLLHESDPGPHLWARQPLAIQEDRLGVVARTGLVSVLEPETGKTVWSHSTRWPNINMVAPHLFGDRRQLFQLLDGWQLQQIDPNTGQPGWEIGLGTEPVPLATAAFDSQALFFVSGNILHALGLQDGKPLWELPIAGPITHWKVVLTRQYTVLFPVDLRLPAYWPSLIGSSPISSLLWGLHGLIPSSHGAGLDCPMIIVDRTRGRIVQQFNFKVQWLGAACQLASGRIVVAAPGTAWGLTTSKK